MTFFLSKPEDSRLLYQKTHPRLGSRADRSQRYFLTQTIGKAAFLQFLTMAFKHNRPMQALRARRKNDSAIGRPARSGGIAARLLGWPVNQIWRP
jgi:hypothetical protein